MSINKQEMKIHFIYKEGMEHQDKENITNTISQYYAEAIINEIKNSVPENEVIEALKIVKEILLKKQK